MQNDKKEVQTVAAERLPAEEPRRPVYRPAVDILETADRFVLAVEMPGVDEHGVDITLEDDALTLTGRSLESAPGHVRIYGEYDPGDYRRVFSLSDEVDREKIEARMKDGVLMLTLAKKTGAQPRRIPVNAG